MKKHKRAIIFIVLAGEVAAAVAGAFFATGHPIYGSVWAITATIWIVSAYFRTGVVWYDARRSVYVEDW